MCKPTKTYLVKSSWNQSRWNPVKSQTMVGKSLDRFLVRGEMDIGADYSYYGSDSDFCLFKILPFTHFVLGNGVTSGEEWLSI